jgi:hypothetical protein
MIDDVNAAVMGAGGEGRNGSEEFKSPTTEGRSQQ